MGGDPKGGRVCWPAGGGVSNAYEVYEQFWDSNTLESAGSPFIGAARGTFNISGFDVPNHAFSSGDNDAVNLSFRWPRWYNAATSAVVLDVYTMTLISPPDGRDVEWKAYGNTYAPGSVVTPTFTNSEDFVTTASAAQELQRSPIGFVNNTGTPTAGHWASVTINRPGTDSNPDLWILVGVQLSIIRTYT